MPGTQLLGHSERPGGVAREHVVVEAELRVVGDGHALVIIIEGNSHDHWAEDLFAGHLHLVGPGDERGLDVVPGGHVLGTTAADDDLALGPTRLDVVEDALLLGSGDHRADDGGGLGRVADGQATGEHGQPFDDLVEDAPMDDGPGRGGADLSGVEGPCRADGHDGGLDVGIVEHDSGSFAAELHEQTLHGRRTGRSDPRADGGGPGEGDHVDIRGGGEHGRRLRPLGADQVDDAGRKAHFVEDTGQLHDGQRVLRGRLDDDGIAHCKCRGDLAGHVGQRKVVAGDSGDHTHGLTVGEGADQATRSERGGRCGDRGEHRLLDVADVPAIALEPVGADRDLHA